MNIKSEKITTQKSTQELFDILSDVKNFKKLMPPKEITRFEVTAEDSFLFALKGTPEIELQLKEKKEPNQIVFNAISKVPFVLNIDISEISTYSSSVQLFFAGKFNPMIEMMIKGPISNLVNILAENTKKL